MLYSRRMNDNHESPPGNSRLAANLRAERSRRDLSQKQLSTISNISRVSIANIERGHNTAPRITTIQSLADALGVQVTALIGESAQ
jgi:transcriptional regulator with XRE-family HTH domain